MCERTSYKYISEHLITWSMHSNWRVRKMVYSNHSNSALHAYSVVQITSKHCSDKQFMLTKTHTLISSASIKRACPRMTRFDIGVSQGQTMNISLWSFTGNDRSLGRVRDLIANNVIDVKTSADSARHQHLATTVGNKIEVDLRSAGTKDVVIFDIDGKNNI